MILIFSGIPFVADLKTKDCSVAVITFEGGQSLSVTSVSRNRFETTSNYH